MHLARGCPHGCPPLLPLPTRLQGKPAKPCGEAGHGDQDWEGDTHSSEQNRQSRLRELPPSRRQKSVCRPGRLTGEGGGPGGPSQVMVCALRSRGPCASQVAVCVCVWCVLGARYQVCRQTTSRGRSSRWELVCLDGGTEVAPCACVVRTYFTSLASHLWVTDSRKTL